jgi:hypothetical protein
MSRSFKKERKVVAEESWKAAAFLALPSISSFAACYDS